MLARELGGRVLEQQNIKVWVSLFDAIQDTALVAVSPDTTQRFSNCLIAVEKILQDKDTMKAMMSGPSAEAWQAFLEEPGAEIMAVHLPDLRAAILQLLQRQFDDVKTSMPVLTQVCSGGVAGESWATPPLNLNAKWSERGDPIIEHGLHWVQTIDVSVFETAVREARQARIYIYIYIYIYIANYISFVAYYS